ncbi:MAG TPA: hypothetical protein DHW49_12480 [Anaerolineae bacterium]|nr:hypothetical protein [Anaerolineae bacterium]
MKYKSLIYERVDLARAGKNPTVISQLSSGWLVLGDNQNIPGYCVFLSDPVVDDIQKLTIAQRSIFLSEMTIAGDAIQKAVNARLMNYSILGNADAGLHAHIHPRYDWEDERFKTKNPFKYYWENVPEVKFELQIHKELIIKIRNEIDVLSNIN